MPQTKIFDLGPANLSLITLLILVLYDHYINCEKHIWTQIFLVILLIDFCLRFVQFWPKKQKTSKSDSGKLNRRCVFLLDYIFVTIFHISLMMSSSRIALGLYMCEMLVDFFFPTSVQTTFTFVNVPVRHRSKYFVFPQRTSKTEKQTELQHRPTLLVKWTHVASHTPRVTSGQSVGPDFFYRKIINAHIICVLFVLIVQLYDRACRWDTVCSCTSSEAMWSHCL